MVDLKMIAESLDRAEVVIAASGNDGGTLLFGGLGPGNANTGRL
jgi:hypothetical protein